MAENTLNLTKSNLLRARTLLLKTARLLDERNIPYHLEGGTLLGIVRDNDLLPWDHDVDISIPSGYASEFRNLRSVLLWRGYKMSVRRSNKNVGPVKKGDYSVFKIKPVWSYILSWFVPKHKSAMVLDVFVKTNDETFTYWQAMDKVMRVDKKYYQSFETIDYQGTTLKVPNHYRDFLTEKYGNWSIPVKAWNAGDQELTIMK